MSPAAPIHDLPERPRRAVAAQRRRSPAAALAGALLAGAAVLCAHAESGAGAAPAAALDVDAALRASEAAIGTRINEHTLLDRDGKPVRLSSYLGKPLLVSFVYTGCFQVCPTGTRELLKTVRALENRFGTGQYNVVSIGFNQPADSPTAMRTFAAQNGIDFPHWSFLSPAAGDVAALAREFGFSYQATPAGFDHVLQVTLIDAEGRIVRQVHGSEIAPDAIGEPLTLLLSSRPVPLQSSLSALVDRVRILCTVYDPRTGTYRVDYGLPLEIAGGLTFAITMLVIWLNERRARRAARRAPRA
ncbi:MAG: SCO family protein [Caldimonas sp.]